MYSQPKVATAPKAVKMVADNSSQLAQLRRHSAGPSAVSVSNVIALLPCGTAHSPPSIEIGFSRLSPSWHPDSLDPQPGPPLPDSCSLLPTSAYGRIR